MYLDAQNLFSNKQAVTATAPATNTIDLGLGDYGPSESLSLFVHSTAFNDAGTLSVTLQTADTVDANGVLQAPAGIASFNIDNPALLAGGKLVAVRLPHGMKRYAGLDYTVAGTLADGMITAGLVLDVQANDYALSTTV